jgi:hypothetical protein
MASAYHWAVNGKKAGPFTTEQLRQLAAVGQLKPTDMLLPDGSPKWVAAGTVAAIFPTTAAVQPARPVVAPVAPPPTAVTAQPGPAVPSANGPPQQTFAQKAFALASSLGGTAREILEEVKTMNKHLAAIAAAVPLLLGPIGDFLTPVLSLNRNVFLVALVLVVVLIVAYRRRDRLFGGLRVTRHGLAIACLVCGILMIGSGGWWLLGWIKGTGNRGFLASNVGFMGKLQSMVLGDQTVKPGSSSGAEVLYQPSVTVRRAVPVTLDQLQRITKVRCEVR